MQINLRANNSAQEMKAANIINGIIFSYSQIEKTLKRQCDEDPALMEKARKNGKLFLADVREMADDAILERLARIGFKTDKDKIQKIAEKFSSSEEASRKIIKKLKLILSDNDEDFLWLGLTVLWERWAADSPSFEILDESMQLGYESFGKDDRKAAEEWLKTWSQYKWLAEKWGLRTEKEFDGAFKGTQFASNWVQDFSGALDNAGVNDSGYFSKSLAVKREILESGMLTNEHTIKNFRGELAEALLSSGAIEEGDRAFEEAISDDPHWAWNYIWWADAYSLYEKNKIRDFEKARKILIRGLAAGVSSDVDVLVDRLEDLLLKKGKDASSKPARAEKNKTPCNCDPGDIVMNKETHRLSQSISSNVVYKPAQNVRKGKPGRNDLCPCGSGKKYKKCCGLAD